MENEIERRISEKLLELRNEKKMTLEQVARSINVHRETVRRYENHPLNMTAETLIRLLDLYDYDVSIFFNEIYGKMP